MIILSMSNNDPLPVRSPRDWFNRVLRRAIAYVPYLGQLPLGTTNRGDQKHLAAIVTHSAKKGYGSPVRRPCRAHIFGWICGQALRVARLDRQDINVEVILILTIPCKSHEIDVR